MFSSFRAALRYLPLLLCTACIVDLDDRCGKDQVVDAVGACSCKEGTELADDKHGCVSTGPPLPAGLGVECEETDNPCIDTTFSRCQDNSVRNYCTSEGCEPGDCEEGYACNQRESEFFCERAPIGQGETCASDGDCAGGEATYCETMLIEQCLVRGCSEGTCFPGWECCDLSSLGFDDTLCVPEGRCPV